MGYVSRVRARTGARAWVVLLVGYELGLRVRAGVRVRERGLGLTSGARVRSMLGFEQDLVIGSGWDT